MPSGSRPSLSPSPLPVLGSQLPPSEEITLGPEAWAEGSRVAWETRPGVHRGNRQDLGRGDGEAGLMSRLASRIITRRLP